MEVVCTKENLQKGLNVVSRLVGKTSSLPILSHLLLETDEGRLKISATNLELGAVCWVGCRIEEEGRVTVPAQLFAGVVAGIAGDQVTLHQSLKKLVVHGGSSNSEMGVLDADDFPLIPKAQESPSLTISASVLANGLSHVINACAQSETRPEISGVYIAKKGDSVVFAATDSYRLAEYSMKLEGDDFSIILPAVSAVEVMRLAGDSHADVEIVLSQNQIFFRFQSFYLVSRLIEGTYPDYVQIIPKSSSTRCVIERTELVKAVKAVALFADKTTNDLRLFCSPADSLCTLSATSSEKGRGESRVSPQSMSGEEQEIVVNHKYLLDGLSNISTQRVVIELSSSEEPAVLRPDDENLGYLYILMPIHI